MSRRHTLPPSGRPVRHLASTAALSGVLPRGIGMSICANACVNWLRSDVASAFNGCMSCYGVRGLW